MTETDWHVITPRLDDGGRIKLRVSIDDYQKLTRGLGFKGVMTDLDTGQDYEIWGASCSLSRPDGGCVCDARAIPCGDDD